MKILIINSNTNHEISEALFETAQKLAAKETVIKVVNAGWGINTIEGARDAAVGALATIEQVQKYKNEFDAFIIACYSDPGLYACREITDKPVLGIAQCSMLAAAALGYKFSVLSPLKKMKPILENLISQYGLSGLCASVRTVEESVLDTFRNRNSSNLAFAEAGRQAAEQDGAEVLCLGGAVFAGRDHEIEKLTGVPCIDGLSVALKMAEMYVLLGYKHAGSNHK